MSLPFVAPRQQAAAEGRNDIVLGGWSCGMKVAGSHGVSLSQANPAHFGGLYDTYLLTPTAAGLTLTMAAISSASATTLAPGYTAWICNKSTIYPLRVLDNGAAEIVSLPPGRAARLDTVGAVWSAIMMSPGEYLLTTTDATPTDIFSISIPTGKAFTITATIIALTGTTPTSIVYTVTGMNSGGTCAVAFDRSATSAQAPVLAVGYNVASAVISVRVTGIAATTIAWKARYDILCV
jgi:hypothetical protein